MSDINYSFELHEYDEALEDGVIETKTPSKEIVTIDDFRDGEHFRTGPEPDTNALILTLENRIFNLIVDESGSMTWNDENADRFTYFQRLLSKLEATYPGQIKVNMVGFGGTLTTTMMFISPANLIQFSNVTGFDLITRQAFGNSVYDFESVRVVRNSDHFPVSQADGTVVSQGIIESAKDTNLTEGKTYYYGVWTFNKDGVASRPQYVSGFPTDRILPEGAHYAEAESRILPGVRRDAYTQVIYNFAEGEGYIIFDSSGQGNHGFASDNIVEDNFWSGDQGSLSYNADSKLKKRMGVRFDGEFDIIESDTNTDIAFATNQNLTISFWLYRYARSQQQWIVGTSAMEASNDIGWAVGLNPDGEVMLQYDDISGGFTVATGTIVPEKEWTMVTIVFDSTLCHIYLNGQESSSIAIAAAIGAIVTIDNQDPEYSETGSWASSDLVGYWGLAGPGYRFATTAVVGAFATWTPTIPEIGTYRVEVWYRAGTNRANNAPYTVNYSGGSETVRVNQQINGSQWFSIGSFPFVAGTSGNVQLSDNANPSVVVADAVRFTRTEVAERNIKLYVGAKPVDSANTWPGVDYFGSLHFLSISNTARSASYVSDLFDQESLSFESSGLESTLAPADNLQREVVLRWTIGDNFDFEGGTVKILRKYNGTPWHDADGDLVLEQNARSGEFIYLDTYNFIHNGQYVYRIFTTNSLGVDCDIKDARLLPVNIDLAANASQLPKPAPVSNIVITPGDRRIMLEWDDPDDPTVRGTKVFYGIGGYPTVGVVGNDEVGFESSAIGELTDTTDGWVVHRILGRFSDGTLWPLQNDVPVYYTIVTYNEYGVFSTHQLAIGVPSSEHADVVFPPAEITDLRLMVVNPETLSVQWTNPALRSERIDQFFGDVALIFTNVRDIYGGSLDDLTNMILDSRTKFEPRPIQAPQTELGFEPVTEAEVFNRTFVGGWADEDDPIGRIETDLQFGVVQSGLIKGTITHTRDANTLARRESYTMLIRAEYTIQDPETGEDVFEFSTQPVSVKFTNPLRMAMLNKNNRKVTPPLREKLPRGYKPCTCPDESNTQRPRPINGCFINATFPYVIRVEIQFQGAALPPGYPIQISAYKSYPESDDDFLSVDPTYVVVNEGAYESEVLTITDEGRTVTKSFVDVEVMAPSMPEDIDLYASVNYQGFLTYGIHTVHFIGSMFIEIDYTKPQPDGIDVAEQFATVWIINPDFPDDESKRIAPPDGTLVKWSLVPERFGKQRPFYSTEEINEFLSGTYSATDNGVARHVFMGPLSGIESHIINYSCDGIPEDPCCLGEEYSIKAEVVLGELSAVDQVIFSYDCEEDPLFSNRRFLLNADPDWQDIVVGHNPEWVTWADGINMLKFQIARNPADSDVLGADCFVQCAADIGVEEDAGGQLLQLAVGQIVQVTADGEILWDVTFDEDPYTGIKTIVSIGGFISQKLAKDLGIPNVANIPIRGETTDFYVRKNAIIYADPKPQECEGGGTPLPGEGEADCKWKGRCDGIGVCSPTEGVMWTEVTPVRGTTTIVVNGKEVNLMAGGGYVDGVPPVLLGYKEPLRVKIIEARKAGQSGPGSRVKLERDDNGQLYLPVEKVADGISHITFVVLATFAGEPISTVEPVFIRVTQDESNKVIFLSNCQGITEGCTVSASGIVFTHLVNDPFINPDDPENPGTVPKKSIAYFTIEPLDEGTVLGDAAGSKGNIEVWMDYDKRGDIDEILAALEEESNG